MSDVVRIGTRSSELALRQARLVQAALTERGVESELVTYRTLGDKRLDAEAGVNAGAIGVWLRIPGGRYEEPGRVDKSENIKEFLSLLDFAAYLREFEGRNDPSVGVPRTRSGGSACPWSASCHVQCGDS